MKIQGFATADQLKKLKQIVSFTHRIITYGNARKQNVEVKIILKFVPCPSGWTDSNRVATIASLKI